MLFNVHESTDTSTVMTLGDHNHSSESEFENVGGLSSGDGDLDNIVNLDIRVRVSDGASIVCDGARDLVGTNVNLVDSAKLVRCFLTADAVQDVSSLDVVKETVTVVGLGHLDDVHESGREVSVSADLSVNLDATFHANLLALLSGQSILKTFTEDNTKRQALTKLVRSLGRSGGPDTAHLADVPVLRSMEALQMLFRSASPVLENNKDDRVRCLFYIFILTRVPIHIKSRSLLQSFLRRRISRSQSALSTTLNSRSMIYKV